MTILRLELEVAVLAIRLKSIISKQLDFFVMNRLNEICSHSTPAQWHYVPTSENPADFLTRFVLFCKLKFHQSWLNGLTLLEQQVNSISVDNDGDKSFEIEEKLTSNLVQTKIQYWSVTINLH